MTEVPRYYAAACQTDLPCPRDRDEIAGRVNTLLGMVDRAVIGYEPFFDVKLVVFPEFAHAAPIYETVAELSDRLAVPIPNEHTDRYVRKARDRGIYIQTGTFLEVDSRWPGVVFNTHLPDRAGRAAQPAIARSIPGSPGSCTPALMTCRVTTSRSFPWSRPRSAASVRQSATTGSSPRPSGAGPGRCGGLDSRLGLHGPLGSDASA